MKNFVFYDEERIRIWGETEEKSVENAISPGWLHCVVAMKDGTTACQ